MAYSPLLLNGSVAEVVLAAVTGLIGLLSFAVAIEGFWLRRTTTVERLAAVAATGLLLSPYPMADAVGAALAMAVVAQLRGPRSPVPVARTGATTAA
jgi:TRAP-type uncharacterized transport system fused permease subunit